VFIACQASAANKYYASAAGSDGNACSISLPCRQVNKLISVASSGDTLLLNGGDSFNSFIVSKSNLWIGSYGTGQPIITGFIALSGWTLLGGGIYQTACAGCSVNTNLLLMNGVQQPLARWPNTGYRTYTSFSGTTSITDPTLTNTPNWTGGYVAIRNNRFTLSTNLITNHSTTVITYTAATSQTGNNNYGYFIIKDSLALDTLGEWWYSPSTGNMKMYFGAANPASYTVQTTTVDTLITVVNNLRNITFSNLDLEGAGVYGYYIGKDTNVVVKNNTIRYSGGIGYWSQQGDSCQLINSIIQYCNSVGVGDDASGKSGYYGTDTISNIALIPGQAFLLQGHNWMGAFLNDSFNIIEYSRIHNTGGNGINIYDAKSCNNNAADSSNLVVDDGGPIYCLGYTDTTVVKRIYQNVVGDGVGAPAGTNTAIGFSNGIYVDQNNANVYVDSNTVYNCSNAGIYFHDSRNSYILGNTVYNCKYQLLFQGDQPTQPIVRMTVKKNVFGISKTTQDVIHFDAFNGLRFNNSFGTLDSNYYGLTPSSATCFYSGLSQTYSQWHDSTSDSHGTLLPSPTLFQYNNTQSPIPLSLTKNYYDALNKSYYISTVVPAFGSLFLVPGSFINYTPGVKWILH